MVGTKQAQTDTVDGPSQISKLPFPGTLPPFQIDPEAGDATGGPSDTIKQAWERHIANGFDQNSQMFKTLLDGFMRPYWITVRMYQALFVLGVLALIAAAVLGVWQGIGYAVLFSGLSVAAFLSFFISQPLRALEQNLAFVTWLGMIYNTYWTRLMYADNRDTAQEDIEDIKRTAIADLSALIDKQAALSGKRPGSRPG